ncbi:hypothetical protein [Streptomyces sp. NPDC047014]|uniref:hypothetical protein n=1 Tax=Streptomyces sp. NPDC047014 TaxID=3155736 RepID=UPI0033FB9EB2
MIFLPAFGPTAYRTPAQRVLHGRGLREAVRGGGPEVWARLDAEVHLNTGPWGRCTRRVGFRWVDEAEIDDWGAVARRYEGGAGVCPASESELVLALCHHDARVRAEALRHAGAGEGAVLPLVLLRCADTDAGVRERARALLGAVPADGLRGVVALALLVGLRRHGGWGWELVFERVGGGEGMAGAEVVRLVGSADAGVRYAAVRAAVRYGLLSRERARELAERDPEPRIRLAALACGALADRDLDALVVEAGDPLVRRAALTAVLGRGAAAPERLLEIAGAAADPWVRRAAIDAVRGQLRPGEGELTVPERFGTSPHVALRLFAAEEDARAGRAERSAGRLADPSARVRAVARRALVDAGLDPQGRYRELCAVDPCAGAVLGLAEERDPADTALLRRLAGHADGRVRAAALAGLRMRRAIGPAELLPYLADGSGKVVRAVRGAVLPYGDALSEAELAGLLDPAGGAGGALDTVGAALVLLGRRPVVVRRRVARGLAGHPQRRVRAWARAQFGRRLCWDLWTGRDAALALLGGGRVAEVLEVEDPAAWAALDRGTRYIASVDPGGLRACRETALCHPSGRVREAAVTAAAGDASLLPLVVLRCADPVRPVREAAHAVLDAALVADPAGTLRVVVAHVLALGGRDRGRWAVARVEEALRAPGAAGLRRELLEGVGREGLEGVALPGRRLAARISLELIGVGAKRPDQLPAVDVARMPESVADGMEGDEGAGGRVRRLRPAHWCARWAAREPDGLLRRRWTEAALALMAAQEAEEGTGEGTGGGADEGAVAALLGAGDGWVRAAGVMALARAGRAAEAVDHLADRSAPVRACARHVVRQSGGDPHALYRAWCTSASGSPSPWAVRGLGESGSVTDAPLLTPLLAHADGAVRAQAVAALVRVGASDGELLPLLDDPSPSVVREAEHALRPVAAELPTAWLTARCARAYARHTRRACLRLLQRQTSYAGLETAVGLLDDRDPEIRSCARAVLLVWPWLATAAGDPDRQGEVSRLLRRFEGTLGAGAWGMFRGRMREGARVWGSRSGGV